MSSLVEMKQIVKVFPNGVVANKGVDFAVEKGEIHALVGENGAGKSTLMKILYGLELPTSGEIWLKGQHVTIPNAHRAIELGIGMVHQNFMLVPSFTIAENVVLGSEPRKGRFVDREEAVRITESLANEYGLLVDPTARIEATPVGMRQRVEILKTLYRGADLLILDEPTAVLTPQETDDLFVAVRKLVNQGKTVIFITHKLVEVKEISDRVTVMRHGEVTGRVETKDVTETDIARMMVGRAVFLQIDKPPVQRGELVAEVRNLGFVAETGRPLLRGVNFNAYAGEILGIAGVEGNGQTELVEVLTGLRPATTGEIVVKGQAVQRKSARAVRLSGVAHIPEDRLTNGVALDASIADNLVVDRYNRPPFTRYGVLAPSRIRQQAQALMAAVRHPRGRSRCAHEFPFGRQYAEGDRGARIFGGAGAAHRRAADPGRGHRRQRVPARTTGGQTQRRQGSAAHLCRPGRGHEPGRPDRGHVQRADRGHFRQHAGADRAGIGAVHARGEDADA